VASRSNLIMMFGNRLQAANRKLTLAGLDPTDLTEAKRILHYGDNLDRLERLHKEYEAIGMSVFRVLSEEDAYASVRVGNMNRGGRLTGLTDFRVGSIVVGMILKFGKNARALPNPEALGAWFLPRNAIFSAVIQGAVLPDILRTSRLVAYDAYSGETVKGFPGARDYPAVSSVGGRFECVTVRDGSSPKEPRTIQPNDRLIAGFMLDEPGLLDKPA
jgi:hypothetical protein